MNDYLVVCPTFEEAYVLWALLEEYLEDKGVNGRTYHNPYPIIDIAGSHTKIRFVHERDYATRTGFRGTSVSAKDVEEFLKKENYIHENQHHKNA